MATYELRSLSLGEILDGALAIYREHIGILVSIVIICQGLPAIMSVYIDLGGGTIGHPLLWLGAFVLSGLGGLVAAAATVHVISEAYLGRETPLGDALLFAWGKIVRLFLAGIAKYVLIFLAGLLLFIPGIVVMCGYAVVTQVVVLENLPAATDALGRSWQLTKGYKAKAFRLGVVVFLLIGLPLLVAGVLASFYPVLFEITVVGGQVLQLLLYPIVACAFTLFYYDLRVRKEAFDLEHLSRQLDLVVGYTAT